MSAMRDSKTFWNWLPPWNVDQLSGSLVLEVLWNGREGGWCDFRVRKILSAVPASDSSERGKSRLRSLVHICF